MGASSSRLLTDFKTPVPLPGPGVDALKESGLEVYLPSDGEAYHRQRRAW